MREDIWCVLINSENIICNGTDFIKYEAPLSFYDYYFWIYLGIYILLTLGAGLMSGLTLGLLSLDALSLEILMRAGIEPEARYAKKLYPIIKRHHILLVTLLLGNAACVESMPIFLDRISNPITAILVSVTAVLIFGEVIPQALCKRYGLAIGYYMRPLVYFLMGSAIIIGYPLSKLLDWIFGHENGSYYRRPQLKALIDIHGPSKTIEDRLNESPQITEVPRSPLKFENIEKNHHQLSIQEVNIIKGALDLTMMTAKDALVPMDKVFMLSDTAILNKQTLRQILCLSHSRIPIYHGTERRLIQGIILTKMLIQFNSSETITVQKLIQNNRCFQPLRYVTETTPLYDLLQLFKTGKTGHMAVVVKDDIADEQLEALERFCSYGNLIRSAHLVSIFPPVLGIITLEDVLEKLIQSDIEDEGDIFRHGMSRRLMYKQKLKWSQYQGSQYSQDNYYRNKSIDSDTLNEYVSNRYDQSTKDSGDHTPILAHSHPQLYRTFVDV